jgi:aminopeptidase
MVDSRVKKHAKILVDYSTGVKKGDVVQILGSELAKPLILELYRQVLQKKPAEVKVHVGFEEMGEIYYKEASFSQLRQFPKLSMYEMEHTDAWIGIRAPQNTRDLTSVEPKKITLRSKTVKPISDWRVEKTRWVITAYPTLALAQEADMSLSEFEDFVFGSIIKVDWKKLAQQQEKLVKRLNRGKRVKILAPDTDLSLSIAGRTAMKGNGENNMPDGEVFTSVVEESVEGQISYSYPAIYGGREVEGIRLRFKKGKVVEALARKGEDFLHKMLDTDRGARFVGELGIGNNYQIKRFVKSILFDEKIGGTVHLALGKGYKETGSRNESAIHWDMILDLRREGELYLDEKLIQKNGVWVT